MSAQSGSGGRYDYIVGLGIDPKDLAKLRTTLAQVSRQATAAGQALTTTQQYRRNKRDLLELASAYDKLPPKAHELQRSVAAVENRLNSHGVTVRRTTVAMGGLQRSFHNIADTITSAASKVALWAVATGSIYGTIAAFRAAISTSADLDFAMTGLRKVYSGQLEDMTKLKQGAIGLAKVYGRNIPEIVNVMRDWARQGYQNVEIMELTRVALMAQNAAEMTAVEATRSLTAALRQWKLDTKDAARILDIWNQLANRYATEAIDIAEGMARFGRTAKDVGFTIEETAATIAIMVQNLKRSGTEIGTALRTLATYAYRPKNIELLEEVGINIERVGKDGKKALMPFLNIMKELSIAWPTLGQAQQQTIAMAFGVRRIEEFRGILGSIPDVMDALVDAYASHGSAAIENEMFLDSLRIKWGQLRATLQSLATDDSLLEFLKKIVDYLIKFADAIARIGVKNTLAFGASFIFLVKWGKQVDVMLLSIVTALKAYNTAMLSASAANVKFNITLGTTLTLLRSLYTLLVGVVGKVGLFIAAITGAAYAGKYFFGGGREAAHADRLLRESTAALSDRELAHIKELNSLKNIEGAHKAQIENLEFLLTAYEKYSAISNRSEKEQDALVDVAKRLHTITGDSALELQDGMVPSLDAATQAVMRYTTGLKEAIANLRTLQEETLKARVESLKSAIQETQAAAEVEKRAVARKRYLREIVWESSLQMSPEKQAQRDAEDFKRYDEMLNTVLERHKELREAKAELAAFRSQQEAEEVTAPEEWPDEIEGATGKTRRFASVLNAARNAVRELHQSLIRMGDEALPGWAKGMLGIQQQWEGLQDRAIGAIERIDETLADPDVPQHIAKELQILKGHIIDFEKEVAKRFPYEWQRSWEGVLSAIDGGITDITHRTEREIEVLIRIMSHLIDQTESVQTKLLMGEILRRGVLQAEIKQIEEVLAHKEQQIQLEDRINKAMLGPGYDLSRKRLQALIATQKEAQDALTKFLATLEKREGITPSSWQEAAKILEDMGRDDLRKRLLEIAAAIEEANRGIIDYQKSITDLRREVRSFIAEESGDFIERLRILQEVLAEELTQQNWSNAIKTWKEIVELQKEYRDLAREYLEFQTEIADDDVIARLKLFHTWLAGEKDPATRLTLLRRIHELEKELTDWEKDTKLGLERAALPKEVDRIAHRVQQLVAEMGELPTWSPGWRERFDELRQLRDSFQDEWQRQIDQMSASLADAIADGIEGKDIYQAISNIFREIGRAYLQEIITSTGVGVSLARLRDKLTGAKTEEMAIQIRAALPEVPILNMSVQSLNTTIQQEIDVILQLIETMRDIGKPSLQPSTATPVPAFGLTAGGISTKQQKNLDKAVAAAGVYGAYKSGDMISGALAGYQVAGPVGAVVGAAIGLMGKKKSKPREQTQSRFPGFWAPPDLMWSTTPFFQAMPRQAFSYGRAYAEPTPTRVFGGSTTTNITVNLTGTGHTRDDARLIARSVENIITRNAEREQFSKVVPVVR